MMQKKRVGRFDDQDKHIIWDCFFWFIQNNPTALVIPSSVH